MQRVSILFLVLMASSASSVYAQRHGRVQYYAVPAPAPAAAQVAVPSSPPPVRQLVPTPEVTVSTGVSCCDGTDGKCSPACTKGKNPPIVESKCPPGTEKCTDIPIEIVPGIDTVVTDEKFYIKCDDHEAKVQVPVLEVRKSERCEFKKFTYKVDCCEVTVCVPCRSCVSESKKCVTKLSDKPYKIRICQRRTGTVDVYVFDVPGMPKQWMLYVDADEKEVKKDLGL